MSINSEDPLCLHHKRHRFTTPLCMPSIEPCPMDFCYSHVESKPTLNVEYLWFLESECLHSLQVTLLLNFEETFPQLIFLEKLSLVIVVRYLKVPSAWFSAYLARTQRVPYLTFASKLLLLCLFTHLLCLSCAYLRTFYVNLTFCVKTVTLVPIYFVFLWNNYTFWIRFCLIYYYYKRRLLIQRFTPKSFITR